MGLYLNPGNEGFFESVSSQIYVDKTELIQYTNQVFRTKQKFLCVSRPRRFGSLWLPKCWQHIIKETVIHKNYLPI